MQHLAENPDLETPSAESSWIPNGGTFKVAKTLQLGCFAGKRNGAPKTWPTLKSWRGGAPGLSSSRGPQYFFNGPCMGFAHLV